MKKELKQFGMYIILTVHGILVMFPIINIIFSSFKTNMEINRATFFPSKFVLDNYIKAVSTPFYITSFINSLVILFFTMLLAVLITSLAGYALARRREKRFTVIYLFFLSAMMIPTAANMTALYSIIRQLGLLDTRLGLILIYTAGAIPMGIMLYSGFIKSIPRELDEAALVDGYGYFKRFYRIILPLMKPIIITQIITSSVSSWNDFFTPLLLLHSPEKKTLTLMVYNFTSEHATNWGAVFALLVLAMLPPILIFLVSQKHFLSGVIAGAVKG